LRHYAEREAGASPRPRWVGGRGEAARLNKNYYGAWNHRLADTEEDEDIPPLVNNSSEDEHYLDPPYVARHLSGPSPAGLGQSALPSRGREDPSRNQTAQMNQTDSNNSDDDLPGLVASGSEHDDSEKDEGGSEGHMPDLVDGEVSLACPALCSAVVHAWQ
jgi:hypothetical protein